MIAGFLKKSALMLAVAGHWLATPAQVLVEGEFITAVGVRDRSIVVSSYDAPEGDCSPRFHSSRSDPCSCRCAGPHSASPTAFAAAVR
jgi:hypothetical protein